MENPQPQNNDEEYLLSAQEVQIGTGFLLMKPVAQHGAIMVSNDYMVYLLGSDNQLIQKEHIKDCSVDAGPKISMGTSAVLTMNGKKYSVSVGHGSGQIGPVNGNLGLGSKKPTDEFMILFSTAKITYNNEQGDQHGND